MRKMINRLSLLRDFYLRREKVSGLPLELVIEVTNQCNLSCIMCIRKKMKRPIGFMESDLYKKIIDEVCSYAELVYLHGLGEPLFHPKIFGMIKYAKKKNLKVGLSTNGTLLTAEKSKNILLSGLDYFIISLDAVTPKTYEKVRGGKNYNQVEKNARQFLKLKRKAKNPPFTVLQFIKLKENEKESDEFRRKWQGLGADSIRIKPVVDLLRAHKKTGKMPHRPCFYIWRQLNMVSWDGKFVTPCCMDANGDYPLGDVHKGSIKKIWNSPKMLVLRRAQITGDWRKLALCKNCTYPQPSLIAKLGAMTFSDVAVKKILPYLERFSLGRFYFYD